MTRVRLSVEVEPELRRGVKVAAEPSGSGISSLPDSRFVCALLCPGIERIQHMDSGAGDVGRVAGHEGQMSRPGCRGHKPGDHRNGVGYVHPTPLLRDVRRDREDAVCVVPVQTAQPCFEDRCLLGIAPAQPLYTLLDLPDHQHAYVKIIPSNRAQPPPYVGVCVRLSDLGHNVGVEQIAQNSTLRAGFSSRLIS
jgi:hypothetical protein